MGKTLVLAEKPSVGRDIARVLGAKGKGDGFIDGADYVVSWAVGHLVTLCEPDELNPAWKKWTMDALPMLPEKLDTKVISKTRAQFAVLKKLLNDASVDRVICATDSGREGELIFRYIYDQAKCKKPVDRLWISSMTDAAIREGLRAMRPDSDYDGLYLSARCRSEADWLVGMNASRAYTLRYDALLSIGRVQTPTLALLVRRDREIAAFQPRDYWEIRADFGDYEGLWLDPETRETRCFDGDKAKAVAAAVKGRTGRVTENERELKRQPPPQLYDLTALQRDANRLMGLSAAKTLDIAQALYEKHKLITYPRTDSRYLPNDMKPRVAKVVGTLPEPWAALARPLRETPKLSASGRVYNDAKVSDHHALVPTGSYAALDKLSDAERRVFDMIAKRLIAVHYPDYEYQSARMTTRVGDHDFRTTGSIPVKEGWKAVYRGEETKEKAEAAPLPDLPVGTERTVKSAKVKACKTKPPEPHTDASLLQAMENAGRTLEDESLRESMKDSGLGTPATRAAIIERLIEVGYARRKGRAILSTEKGDRLISVAPEELTSPVVTGRWEKSLAVMARENDPAAMAQLSGRFMEGIRRFAAFLVEQAKTAAPDVAFEPEARRGGKGGRRKAPAVKDLDVTCPLCGQGHVTENSKAFSCSRWREGCNMTVWKNCLESRGGPTLTPALMKLIIEKREVAGSTGVIRYEPGRLPTFEPNEKAVIPEKKKSPAKKNAAKKTTARKKTDSSSTPKKRSRKSAAADEQPIESLLDLLEK
ncbi:MAG: DNA topoisomerase 3 [Clostridia bacterium]|nr:DNA topoisomerase 3 [Clostridia bacterium]